MHLPIAGVPPQPILRTFALALMVSLLPACGGQTEAVATPVQTTTVATITAAPAITPVPTEVPADQAAVAQTVASAPPQTAVAQAVTPAAGSANVQDGKPLAARVNGQPVYLDSFDGQVSRTEQALAEQGILLEGADGDAQKAQIRETVLKGLIEQALIEQAAIAMQIRVTDEEVEQSLQNGTSADGKSLETWLAENNLTLDELRRMQRSQLTTSRVIQELGEVVPTTAEQVHARHIFTTDQSRTEGALTRLAAGEDFATVAKEVSEDLSTATNGGDLGWFPRQTPMMPPVVMDAVFSLSPGQTSGVIRSEIGYHIVRVEGKEANRALTDDMLMYVRQLSFRAWLDQQTTDASVERYVAQ